MPLAPGTRLGSYEIVAPLGAGGMGEVYAARDSRLGRDLAIKLISTRRGIDAHTLARFTNEARSASALNHPNIVTIYEVDLNGEQPYIAMELVEGRDLRELMRQGPLPIRKILDIGTQTAEGLAAAHDRGIVHRDLKPENIMVTKSGFVKVLDFGLAKLIADGDAQDPTVEMPRRPETRSGTIVGTAAYMSPEQANGHPLDFRSDQFSFGAILYELTAMRPAFHRPTTVDTLSAVVHDEPESIERLNARAPAPFRWIIERCLTKDPDGRYASTRDLARELRTVRDRLPETTVSVEDIYRPPAATHKGVRVAAVLIFLVAVGTGAAFFLQRREGISPSLPIQTGNVAADRARSVAVLPFHHMGEAADASLLGLGFADSLSGRLARFSALQVMRPGDAKMSDASQITKIARELGADLVIRGAIQRTGGRVRVSWSLLDPLRGVQLAGATLDGTSTDLFSLQDAVADGVAAALQLEDRSRPVLSSEHLSDRYLEALGYLQRYENEASVDGAIRLLESLRAEGAKNAEVEAALGRAYLRKHQLTKDATWIQRAEEACRRALAADDTSPEARITAGEVYLARGDAAAAIRELRSAVAQQPSSIAALLALADAQEAGGDPSAAAETLQRATRLNPRYWATHNRLGVLLLNQGKFRESIPHFQRVVELTPDNVRGYNNLGAAHQQLGNSAAAIDAFEQSIAIRPNATAFTNLGTTLFYEGKFKEAARHFNRAVDLVPESYVLWANLADSHRWSNEGKESERQALRKAIELARGVLRVNPNDANARGRLAVCLAKDGELAAAQKEIDLALSRAPGNVMLNYNAAVIAHLAGDSAAARQHLTTAVRMGLPRQQINRDPELRDVKL